jgi:hypothetical protein
MSIGDIAMRIHLRSLARFERMRTTAIISTSISLLLSSGLGLAQPPSFDCKTNTAPDEQAICANQTLAELDRLMAVGYEYVRAKYGNSEAKRIGRPLLESRQACGRNKTCIERSQLNAIKMYISLGAPINSNLLGSSQNQNLEVTPSVTLNPTTIPSSLVNSEKQLLRRVMDEFYGYYDNGAKCWISKRADERYCMKPIKLEIVTSKKGRQLFIAIGGQKLAEDGHALDCHVCTSALGFIVLGENGLTLGLVAKSNLYEDYENFGRMPKAEAFSLRELGTNGSYGWIIKSDFESKGGEYYRWLTIYGVVGDMVTSLASITSYYEDPVDCKSEGNQHCTNISVNLLFDAQSPSTTFYPLVLRASGIKQGRPFRNTYRVQFDGRSLKYLSPPNTPDDFPIM